MGDADESKCATARKLSVTFHSLPLIQSLMTSTTVTKPRIRPFPIIQLGHPTLWKKSEHVNKDQDLSHTISRMFKTLRHADGAGLAAPQINQSLRLFVMDIHPTLRRPKIKRSGEHVIINPRILSQSEEVVEDWEGCLSVTTTSGLVFGTVPRAREIEVTYEDASRTVVKRNLVDFEARVFLHEFDHLEGIVFLQRMSRLNELIDEKTYLSLLKSANTKVDSDNNPVCMKVERQDAPFVSKTNCD